MFESVFIPELYYRRKSSIIPVAEGSGDNYILSFASKSIFRNKYWFKWILLFENMK